MATEYVAAKMKEDFLRQQSRLSAQLRTTAVSHTIWILALVGVVLICFTLYKIPTPQGGVPLPLNHEFLISFAVCSGIGSFLHLLVFFMYLLAYMNEKNLNKIQLPSLDLVEKCLHKQNKLMLGIQLIEAVIFHFGSTFGIYVFLVAVTATFLPYVTANGYTASVLRHMESASQILLIYKIQFPGYWMLE